MTRGWERLLPSPGLESHDLVTTAVRRGASPDLATIGEPLELLCRDLAGPAGLHRVGRRDARRWLLSQIAAPAQLPPSAGGRPSMVVVTGADPGQVDAVAAALAALGPTEAPRDGELLDRRLRRLDVERRWHLPSWAEWFEGTDHTDAFAPLRHADADGPRLLASWQHRERLDQVIADCRAVVVVVGAGDDVVDRIVADVVARRRRASDVVDPAAVDRYWRWRCGVMDARFDAWRATSSSPVLDVDGDEDATRLWARVREALD